MDKAGVSRVYTRLTRTKPDGTVLNLRVQDMPEDRLEDVVDLLKNHFLVDEPIHRSSGIYLNQNAIDEYCQILTGLLEVFKPHIVICCEDEDPGVVKKIAGASVMHVATKMTDLSNIPVQTKEVKKLFEMGMNTFYTYDPVNEHKVDKFYDDVFIVVHPDYRRLGIAYEFVHSRRVICKEQNIPLAVAWMSAKGTQRAAESDDWELAREVSYDDLAKKYNVVFDTAPPTSKLMLGWPC